VTTGPERLEPYLETERQLAFERDFLAGWERLETWDGVGVGERKPAAREFLVTEEDVVSFNRAVGETDPLFVEPGHARDHSPTGHALVHPLFVTTVIFWCTGPEGPGSWIRTPGARNPFQRIELVEPIEVGDTVTVTTSTVDRFVRNGMHYLTNLNELHVGETLKARSWATLILPPTRDDIRGFAEA
jgi:acyl dehydratase